ncbi:Heterokaryon incompatibility protein 6, OR allele [Madurella mycetomatis]|uniref:Heterokaryon incompatibility protein 6, OR allele n=1 Tax=Madurella mycetomatis TaxID=100816 RepID=A0A175W3X2_9PEZI|nr:Heterokaryon incompatibility protein 6, OR allele [Madurella mycetomatis]
MATTTPFQYTSRLAAGEIRLLSLIRSTNPDSPLRFRLSTTRLSAETPDTPSPPPPPPYIALSYVWGSEDDPLPILILQEGSDNMPPAQLLITRNLHSALHHLSRHELPSLPIWADAVCINQSDAVEKTSQIARMADVYRRAERVIVFLGETSPTVDRVVPQLDRVGRKVYAAGAMMLKEADLVRWPSFEGCEWREEKVEVRKRLEAIIDGERGGLMPVLGRKPGVDCNAALDLFHRPWFARAWVVQEICMASAERDGVVVFAVGGTRIIWEQLWGGHMFLVLWLLKEGKAIGDAETLVGKLLKLGVFIRRTRMIPRGFSSRASATLGMRKKFLQGDLNRSLKSLLTILYTGDMSNPLGCKYPEDKIGAIRSLANDGDFLDAVLKPGVSWQAVYVSLARELYRRGNLDFLSLCRQRSPTLPSWVTDWSHQQRPPWLGYKTGDASQLFDAGKGTAAQVYDDESDDKILCLRGFIVDTIQEVGSEWTSHLDEAFNWESAKLRIIEIDRFRSLSRRYSPAETAAARWRIIVADREANDLGQNVRATEAARESFAKPPGS